MTDEERVERGADEGARETRPRIVPFRPTDYDEALALWRRCEGVGLSSADSPEAIVSYLERNPTTSFTARSDGRLVGTILCGHDGRRGYVHHLAVAPEHRRRGIGTALTEACLEALRAQGIEKCHLFVYVDNEDAIGFWQRRRWVYRTDIAVMSLELDAVATGPEDPAVEGAEGGAADPDFARCSICSRLGEREWATVRHGWEEEGGSLPPAAAALALAVDLRPGDTTRRRRLLLCPECGTYYLYQTDYEYLAGGSEDEESLTRLTATEAQGYLGAPLEP